MARSITGCNRAGGRYSYGESLVRIWLPIACLVPLLFGGCGHGRYLLAPTYYEPSLTRFVQEALCEAAPQRVSVNHISVALPDLPPPRTPRDYEAADAGPMCLAEAITLALENSEVVRTISGPGLTAPQSTVYDPVVTETQVQTALAAFDTSLQGSMFWERRENPPAVSFQGLLDQPERLDLATFRSSVVKPFSGGGQGRISLDTDYVFQPLPDSAPIDDVPQYNPRLEFGFRQPFFRGAGTALNRAPLVIARAETDRSLWEFQRTLMRLAADVEASYWQLDAARVSLKAIDQVLPLAAEVVRVQEERLKVQVAVPADVALAQTSLEQFRQRRIQAVAAVLQQEATLRNLVGLPPNDGLNVVTTDKPLEASVVVDWHSLLETAVARRPDIMQQRLAVRRSELSLLQARNGMLPRVDGEALWRINGSGNDLNQAFGVVADDRFTDWQLGFSVDLPLFNHQATAAARAAELALARERALLRNSVHAASHELAAILRDIEALHLQYESAQRRQTQAGTWRDGAQARFENPAADTDVLLALITYLEGLDAWATATADMSQLLALYNTALVRLEEAKGSLLETHHIVLLDDPSAAIRRGRCDPLQWEHTQPTPAGPMTEEQQ